MPDSGFITVGRNRIRAAMIEAVGVGPDERVGVDTYCRVNVFTTNPQGCFSTESMLKSAAEAEVDRIIAELSHA